MSTLAHRVSALAAAAQQNYVSQYLSVLSAMSPTPSMGRKAVDHALIRSLDFSGWRQTVDRLIIAAAASEQNVLVDWCNPSIPAVKRGTVTFTENFYFQGDGTTGWIDLGFVPNGGAGAPHFLRDNHCFAIYIAEDVVDAVSVLGAQFFSLAPHATTNSVRYRSAMDTTDVPTLTGGIGAGWAMVRRVSGSECELWWNKNKVLVRSAASVDISTIVTNFAIGGFQNTGVDSYSTRKVVAFIAGGAPTDEQWVDWVDSFSAWHAAIGAAKVPDYTMIGAMTDTTATVGVNMPAAADGETVTLELSASSSFSTIDHTFTDTAVLTEGLAASYCNAFIACSGLTANTRYYGRIKVGSVYSPDQYMEMTTFPQQGVAAAFNFATLSCTRLTQAKIAPLIHLTSLNPLFYIHQGDIDYGDYKSTDIRGKRDQCVRTFARNASAKGLNRKASWTGIFDDHDSWGNDGMWRVVGFPEICSNARQVIREQAPYYPLALPSGKTLLHGFWIAKTYAIVMDTRSQQIRFTGPGSSGVAAWRGQGTMLGRDYDIPEFDYYPDNQFQKIVDMATAAVSAGAEIIWLVSPTDLVDSIGRGWEYDPDWIAERTMLANALHPLNCRFVWLVGDIHANAMADDASVNFATVAGGSKWAAIVASPTFNAGTFTADPTKYSWNGGSGVVADPTLNGQSFPFIKVAADNRNFEVDWYVKPSLLSNTRLTPWGSFNSADLPGWA